MRGLISSFIWSHSLGRAAIRRVAADRRAVNKLALRPSTDRRATAKRGSPSYSTAQRETLHGRGTYMHPLMGGSERPSRRSHWREDAKHDGSDDRTVGVGSHGGERNEKGQRTEPIERPTGDGVHRRAAGDAAARSAHPRPDDRPRPPSASCFPVRSCAQAVGGGRRTDRVTAPDSGLRFTWRLIPPSGSLAPETPRKALPTTKPRPTQWLARHYLRRICPSQ